MNLDVALLQRYIVSLNHIFVSLEENDVSKILWSAFNSAVKTSANYCIGSQERPKGKNERYGSYVYSLIQ